MSLFRITETIFEEIKQNRKRNKRDIQNLFENINGTGFSYSFASYTVSALPSTISTFQLAYATNGRKSGETAGNGTGCPVWYDESSSKWLTFYDNTEVQD